MPGHLLRSLPSIERLLERPASAGLSATLGREQVRDLLREITDELREEVVKDQWAAETSSQSFIEEVERRLQSRAALRARPSLRRVVNATGVVIHTNLGRAPLSTEATQAVAEVAAHYSNLEYDLGRGERGQRETHCQELLARLTGSEAAVLA